MNETDLLPADGDALEEAAVASVETLDAAEDDALLENARKRGCCLIREFSPVPLVLDSADKADEDREIID